MKIQLAHSFEDIISVDNLLSAWPEFIKGKRKRKDVTEFSLQLMDNLIQLHNDLIFGTYSHGPYESFNIYDPKPRNIHKATVRDRVLHRAIYRRLYPFFDNTFIADSFSCRTGKGTHRAINRFRGFAYQVSQNHTRTCWTLKCDIKKFFASINHDVLLNALSEYIPDKRILKLLENIITSFNPGLPLGNLTSQLLANVYMNKLDQFIKHTLKARYYVRYADDFVILSQNREYLEKQIQPIKEFLSNNLKLTLHPDKVFIKTVHSGVDFLGWVNFTDHRVLRRATRRRMLKRVQGNATKETVDSYLGLVKHGNARKIEPDILMCYSWQVA